MDGAIPISLPKMLRTAAGWTLPGVLTERAAEECGVEIVGNSNSIDVTVEPHPLHSLEAVVRVPERSVE